jgi:hypothetical protein
MVRRIVYGVLGLLVIFECSYWMFARKAAAHARSVGSQLGTIRLGLTDRSEIEKRFSAMAVHLDEEPCSGEGCTGLSLSITNYPRFMLSEYVAADRLLAQLSIARPTAMSVDFYFDHDLLQEILLTYKGPGSLVNIRRYSSSDLNHGVSKWLMDGKMVRQVAVGVPENASSPRSALADSLDFACLDSVRGCHNALELWPGAPAATAPWKQTRPE